MVCDDSGAPNSVKGERLPENSIILVSSCARDGNAQARPCSTTLDRICQPELAITWPVRRNAHFPCFRPGAADEYEYEPRGRSCPT
jgi:hypothetical protein